MPNGDNSFDIALRFAAILDSSNDAIISIGLDGIIASWNSSAEKIFGYIEEEALGKHISIILPEERLFEEVRLLERIRNDEKIEHFETVRLNKNRQRIPISLSISPIKNNEGVIIGASKIARDISYQKNSEQKNAMLAAIVDSSDDIIISKNLDGIITSWNKSAERILGYTEAEAIGKHITLIIPERGIDEEKMIISRIKNGERIEHFETKRVCKDGNEIDLSITVSPIKNEKGEIIGASKVARDIADRVKAREQLEKYTKELQKLNRYKDEFISVASHELNTPITSLKVYLHMLEKSAEAEINAESDIPKYAEKAISLTNKVAKLVKDLLDVSRIETGKIELEMLPFDCKEVLLESIDSMSVTTRSHRIIYEGSKEPVIVVGDKSRLEQAFMNLISNAIKYSPDADKIIVEAKEEDNRIIISVEDFGIGIPSDQAHNIFSRFFRVDSISSAFSGLGIGLYLSNQIIKAHGGIIEFRSQEDKGSTFTITLPIAVDEKSAM